MVTDVGQHQMWEAQYFTHLRPGQLITSGGLGTMGFGVPAAIGAKLAKPDEIVWAIVGDGGFQQTLQELATIVQENVAVKIGIINNGFLGMVRQWQQFFYEKRYAGTPMLSPDYMKLADAYGIASLPRDQATTRSTRPSSGPTPTTAPSWSSSRSKKRSTSIRWWRPARPSARCYAGPARESCRAIRACSPVGSG